MEEYTGPEGMLVLVWRCDVLPHMTCWLCVLCVQCHTQSDQVDCEGRHSLPCAAVESWNVDGGIKNPYSLS